MPYCSGMYYRLIASFDRRRVVQYKNLRGEGACRSRFQFRIQQHHALAHMRSLELSVFFVMPTDHFHRERSRLAGPDLVDGYSFRMNTLHLHALELSRRVRSQEQHGSLAMR